MGSKRAQKRAKRESRRRTRRAQREAAPAAQPKPSPTRPADPLIGYLARHDLHVLCDGDGCVIAGSREKLQDIIRRSGPAGAQMDTIQSATFSEILAYTARQKRHVCAQVKCPTAGRGTSEGMFFLSSSAFKQWRLEKVSGAGEVCELESVAGMKRGRGRGRKIFAARRRKNLVLPLEAFAAMK